MDDFGILYILFNLKNNTCSLMKELILSIKSIKKFHKDINIKIYLELNPTYNEKIPVEILQYIEIIKFSSKYKFNYDRNLNWLGYKPGTGPIGINRLLCLLKTPYKYTLHLDCDTIINKPIDYLIYNCKEDLYITFDNWWVLKDDKLINELENNKSSINSGLILYKNTKNNRDLFNNSIDLIYKKKIAEQNAISKLLKKYNVLNNKLYNFRCKDLKGYNDYVILHKHI